MAPFDGRRDSFTDTTPNVRVVTDFISIISPRDTPLLARFGIHTSPPPGWKFQNFPHTKIEWLEDELLSFSTTLNGSIASNTTAITVADASVLHVGDVVQIESELIWLSAVNKSTEVVTGSRAFGGTTAASHADALTVERISNARLEGADSDSGGTTDITSDTNEAQIFHDEVLVSGTIEVMKMYGITDEAVRQGDKKMQELSKLLEIAAIRNGTASARTASVPGAMRGLLSFLDQSGANTVTVSTAVTQAKLEAALLAAYSDGGNPTVAICSPTNMQTIKNFYDNSSFLRIDRTERTVGMVVEQIVTPFGTLELLMDRWMPDNRIPLIDPNHYAGVIAIRPWMQELLAKTGDSQKFQIIGEFTQALRHAKLAHALVKIS